MKKLKALDSLRSKFKSDLLDEKDLSPMEVTVGADSEEGLEEGLELAKDVVKKGPQALGKELPSLDMEDEDDDLEDLDEEAEEIFQKLQASPELMEKLVAKLSL